MALKVGELFASFNLDTSGVSGAVSSAEKQLSNIGKGLMVGGTAMTAAVTVPIKKAATAIYDAGTGFDAQMSQVFAIVGEEATGSAETMEMLTQKALEMGSTTSFTAAEAGEAMMYMAMAGWKTGDMMAGLAPIMNLAAASGENLGTVSDIVTDALTAFGLTADDAAHFADVLAAASSNSNTNVAIMGESFKYVAPLAGSLGYSVDDVAVALGLMANAGIKGSMAGTSLRQILSNLISPTESQAAAMEALGVSLYDSNGMVKDFATLMGDLRGAAKASGFDMQALRQQVTQLDGQLAAGTITQEQYDAQIQALTEGGGDFLKAISDLAGARGLSGLLAIMNASEEDFLRLTGAVEESTGAAENMAAVMLDNAKGDITLFNSALEGLEITLWHLAEGGFREAIQSATKWVDAFRTTNRETQEGVLRWGALAAAAGPVTAALGGLITLLPTLAKTFAIVSGPGAMLALGLVALGAAAIDSGNSMGKTFVTGAAKAGTKIRQLGKDVKKQLPGLTANMKEFLISIRNGIQAGLPGILEGLGDILFTGLSALAGNMGRIAEASRTLVKTLAEGIRQNLPQLVPAAITLVAELAAAVIGNMPAVWDAGAQLFVGLLTGLNSVDWTQVGTTIHGAISDALTSIHTNLYTLIFGEEPAEGDLGDWGKLGSKITGHIRDGIAAASQHGKNLIGGLTLGDDYSPDDSWGTVATKIFGRIQAGMGDLVKNASDLLIGLVLGDNYTPGDSWATVADKIWGIIQAKFAELKQSAKDLIGALVLDGGYTADTSWGEIGSAIWKAIKDRLTGLKQDTKDLVGNLVLGSEYTADTSWEAVATAIWDKIRSAMANLGKNAKDLIGSLVFTPGEGGYVADPSWADIGSALWAKVQEGVAAGKDIAAAILEKISNIEIDVGGVVMTVKNAAAFATRLVSEMLNGRIAWGTKITAFAQKIGDQLAAYGWDNIGASLGQTAGNLVSAITAAIPNAINAAGEAVNVGFELASGILTAIESALTGEGLDLNLGAIVQALVDGLSTALGGALDFGGQVVTVGAKLAGELLDSLMGAFDTEISTDGMTVVGDKLRTVAQSIVDGITTVLPKLFTVGGKAVSAGLKLATDLMQSLAEGFTGGEMQIDLTGAAQGIVTGITDAVKNLPNAIEGVLSAGAQIANAIMGSIASALTDLEASGVADSLSGAATELVSGLLKSVTKLSENPDVQGFVKNLGEGIRACMGMLGNIVGDLIRYIFSEQGLTDIFNAGKALAELLWAGIEATLSGAGELLLGLFGLDSGSMTQQANEMEADIAGIFNQAFHFGEDNRDFSTLGMKAARSIWVAIQNGMEGEEISTQSVANLGKKYFKEGIDNAVASGFMSSVDAGLWKERVDQLSDDFWLRLGEAVTQGTNGVDLLSYLFGYAVENSTPEVDSSAEAILEKYGIEAGETAQEAMADGIAQAMDAEGNTLAVSGFATAVTEGMGEAETAAYQVGDAAVRQFLLTMSAENGAAIGSAFVGGIAASVGDGSLVTASEATATAAVSTVEGLMSADAGSGIGENFGSGLVAGVNAMAAQVSAAAWRLGLLAAGALALALGIHSPSKVTAETGRFFGLGFIDSIMDSAGEAGEAAAWMGTSAVGALYDSVSELSGLASEQMSLPARSRQTEMERAAIESERTAQRYADAIARALNGAKVVMDGEAVGGLVMETVSEGIASAAGQRRYGTV